jgi:nucleoside phosphorylase
MNLLVPRGAEAAAVRRADGGAHVFVTAAGRHAADGLPALARGEAAVMVGLCGALRDRQVGDVVVYHDVVDEHHHLVLDAALADAVTAAFGEAYRVRGCTAGHVVVRVAERRAMAGRYDADVVDMEGTYVAAALAAAGVRVAMVRVVSDDARRDLPALEGAIRPDGSIDALRVAAAFVREPLGALRFVRDARRALTQLTRVARVLAALPV